MANCVAHALQVLAQAHGRPGGLTLRLGFGAQDRANPACVLFAEGADELVASLQALAAHVGCLRWPASEQFTLLHQCVGQLQATIDEIHATARARLAMLDTLRPKQLANLGLLSRHMGAFRHGLAAVALLLAHWLGVCPAPCQPVHAQPSLKMLRFMLKSLQNARAQATANEWERLHQTLLTAVTKTAHAL